MRIYKILLTSIFLFIVAFGQASLAVEASTPERQEAGLVVSQYVQGLIAGDITLISNSLSPELWDDRKAYVQTAGYESMLRKQYQGAQYQIREYRPVSAEEIDADVGIEYATGHTKSMTFRLRKDTSLPYPGYRIVEER